MITERVWIFFNKLTGKLYRAYTEEESVLCESDALSLFEDEAVKMGWLKNTEEVSDRFYWKTAKIRYTSQLTKSRW